MIFCKMKNQYVFLLGEAKRGLKVQFIFLLAILKNSFLKNNP